MLTPHGYKQRLIEKQLDKYLEIFGAICIEGPKYCGKTWTALSRSKSVANIGDPTNNFQTRSQAQINPAFVLEGNHPRLVDEWQEVPSLWDAVRYYCDKNIQKGLYVLTGSAT
ncbi:MAG: AAA family ATPase, partial [Enterococcus sp.]|nr:AAA family ATPase [Enterococcus sp.]